MNKKNNCILNLDAFKMCLYILIFQSIWSLFTISGCQIFIFITSNPSRSLMFFPNWLVFGSTTKRRFITGMKFFPFDLSMVKYIPLDPQKLSLEADPHFWLIWGCMLMNSRGGPPFGGCMLMNSRGGPPFGGLYVDEIQRRTPIWLMKPRGGPPSG